jgi:hypothetical protein
MTVRLSALHTSRALLPRNIIFLLLILVSVRGLVNLGGLVWLEGLSKLKKIDLTGSRTNDLPACSKTIIEIHCIFYTELTIYMLHHGTQRNCHMITLFEVQEFEMLVAECYCLFLAMAPWLYLA